MRKIMVSFAMFLCLLSIFFTAVAALDQEIEDLIHDALLATMPARYYPESECFAEQHAILGTQEKGDTLEIYLSASVGGYGFMGGGFVMQSGWGGPCTVILQKTSGGWVHKETLEIEDYSEIPKIMPAWAEERFFAGGVPQSNRITDQLTTYLQSIGRTEPILSYSDVSGELPNILVHASNMIISLCDDYPLGMTWIECLEDGVRYLYSNSFAPDEDGVQDPVYETEKGRLSCSGTTGTQILQKVRKEDGKVMESITIRSQLYLLTITVADDYGSVEYVLPFDGREYRQPEITRKGDCHVDVARFEEQCSRLQPAGQALPEQEILSVLPVSERERFAVMRKDQGYALVYEQYAGGVWKKQWQNENIIPAQTYDWIRLSSDTDSLPTLREYVRFAAQRETMISILAGYSSQDVAALHIHLERKSGEAWNVISYSDDRLPLHAYLFEDDTLYYAAKFSAMHLAGLAFERNERAASAFGPAGGKKRENELKSRMKNAPQLDGFDGAEALYVSPGIKVQYPVYTAPDEGSMRGAKGKASVSFNDWVALLGKEGDWLLILYETSSGHYRVGWIDAGEETFLTRMAKYTMPLQYGDRYTETLKEERALFDDPINETGTIVNLPAGHPVTVLQTYFAAAGKLHEIAYVETVYNGQALRGFVGMPL